MNLSEFKIWFDGFLSSTPKPTVEVGLAPFRWEALKETLLNLEIDVGSSIKTNPKPSVVEKKKR